MIRALLLWASRNPGLARAASRVGFVRRAVRRFIPGEDRSAAVAAAMALSARGIPSVFTLLGENVASVESVDHVVAEYRELLDEIRGRGLDAQISVKLTQLGLDLEPGLACRGLVELAEHAREGGSMVWIDMEDSSYRDGTLRIYREAVDAVGVEAVGLCLQAYLRVTKDDLDGLGPLRHRVRMVKGAYREPSHLAFPRKQDVDQAYFDLVRTALSAQGFVAVATHDPDLVERVRDWIRDHGIPKERYEFQMLFGIGSKLREELNAASEPLRVLISYGPAWFPWYMRRLAERPANLMFLARSLFRG